MGAMGRAFQEGFESYKGSFKGSLMGFRVMGFRV